MSAAVTAEPAGAVRGRRRRQTLGGPPGWRPLAEHRRSCCCVFVVLYARHRVWQDDSLLTIAGVRSILLLACPLAIFAASQTLCMLTGGIDLSIVMTANFAAYVAANQSGQGTVVALGLALGVGIAVGLVNGIGDRRVQGQPADHDPGHGQRAPRGGHRRAAGLVLSGSTACSTVVRRARLGHADRAPAEQRRRVGAWSPR